MFFVILASAPLGRLLARVLPDYTVPLGRFSFSLNPGPFSIKEHAIVGIAANAGSQGQWASKYRQHTRSTVKSDSQPVPYSLSAYKCRLVQRHHHASGDSTLLWLGKTVQRVENMTLTVRQGASLLGFAFAAMGMSSSFHQILV